MEKAVRKSCFFGAGTAAGAEHVCCTAAPSCVFSPNSGSVPEFSVKGCLEPGGAKKSSGKMCCLEMDSEAF